MNGISTGEGDRSMSDIPLAGYCSLCGGGYHPHLEIKIGNEPTERDGEQVYGWAHRQCMRDHDRAFLQAAKEGDLQPVQTEDDRSDNNDR
jgi:hypothetical protein